MNDLKYALRQWRRHPGFTVVAVLTLAFGIGVNTSMFTALQASILRPLPFPEADRLVRVFRTTPQTQNGPHSVPGILEQQAQNESFEALAAYTSGTFGVAEPGQPPVRARGFRVSPQFFSVLQVMPRIGRAFSPQDAEPGRGDVVVLSHGFWLDRFAGDPGILGRTIRMDGESVVVIGVMPESMVDVRMFGRIDLWRPLVLTAAQRTDRGSFGLQAIGRLKSGLSFDQAQAGMNTLAGRFAQAFPEVDAAAGLRLVRLADSGNANGRRILWLVMGLAGVVLLIACANAANLQFARAAGRSRELAIRGALGADGRRVFRQLLVESLAIAFLGGLVALLLAVSVNRWLERQIPNGGEPGLPLPLNLPVFAFALVATVFAGFAFGLLPAWQTSRMQVNEALKQGALTTTRGPRQHRLRHALVVAQMALALVLLTGAGVMVGGLHRFTRMDPGWRTDGLVAGYLQFSGARYEELASRLAFTERLRERLAALPGVERAALSESLPVRGIQAGLSFVVEGRPAPAPGHEPNASISGVTPGFFATLGIRLLEGRDFTAEDTASRPGVVVVNQSLARAFWPGESAVGKRIGDPGAWLQVVGVVNDVGYPANVDDQAPPFQWYRPLAQEIHGSLALAVRGPVAAETLRREVAALDPDLVLNDPGSVRQAVARQLGGPYLILQMLGGFSALGLFLAGLGLYGVMAGFVAERTREIGVRMALGAELHKVLWLVVGRGMRLALVGAAVGGFAGLGLARVMAGTAPILAVPSTVVIAGAAALLASVALVSLWLPARRAARVDPMTALRAD